MAMRKRKIKFALEMKDGEQVRDLEALQEHFDLEKVIGYFQDGKLLTWLEDRFYDDEADAVRDLSGDDPALASKLCKIFSVEDDASACELDDPETIAWRKMQLEKLKQYTADENILKNVDLVAFEQDDLEDILREEDTNMVYLCQNKFVFPSGILRRENVKYIGIGKNVEVVVKSKEPIDFHARGISFENIRFDEAYASVQKDSPEELLEKGKDVEAMNESDAMGVSLDINNNSNSTYAESSVIIANNRGIHAGPASIICQTANKFSSKVMIQAKGRSINAKSILMIMSMGLTKGTSINIIAEGIDAEDAVSALTSLVNSQFGE